MDGTLIRDALGAALLSGVVGTGTGSLLGAFFRLPVRLLQALLQYTAGLMAAIACFDMIPGALDAAGILPTLLGIAAGLALMLGLETVVPGEGMGHTGWMALLAISLHNLPEGLCIGAGYALAPAVGLKMALVICLHDLPEGVAVAAPLRAGGQRPAMALLLSMMSGLPTIAGALLGLAMGTVSAIWVAFSLGMAAGTMAYVACGEMGPTAAKLKEGGLPGLWQVLGLMTGLVASLL